MASSTATAAAQHDEQDTEHTSLPRRAGQAAVTAVTANTLLVLLADLAGIAPELAHLQYGRVAALTVVGVVGATLLYAGLSRVVANPDRTFVVITVAVAALSMIPTAIVIPTEPGATVLATVLLGVMHLPPAATALGFLTGRW